MTMNEIIGESAAKFGSDLHLAKNLHRMLCESKDPAAKYAAVIVMDIIEDCANADAKMRMLASLAGEK